MARFKIVTKGLITTVYDDTLEDAIKKFKRIYPNRPVLFSYKEGYEKNVQKFMSLEVLHYVKEYSRN